MSFQITLKLNPQANPFLYINQLKEFMKNDTYLHPLMRNTLQLMKKSRMPYVRLATVKEIIFVPSHFFHMERAIEPSLTDYAKIDWSEEERVAFSTNSKAFFENILEMYEKLGYEFGERKEIDDITLAKILSTIKSGEKNE